MVKKKIIKINESKCIGCALCIMACKEGAIQMIDGKAKLVFENYCDGLGNCLPACPTNAISFIECEIKPSLKKDTKKKASSESRCVGDDGTKKSFNANGLPCNCPSKNVKRIVRNEAMVTQECSGHISQLSNWPLQIKLVPVNASYFENANLLISADCCAYAYADFHNKFIKNRIIIIGCPKLDEVDYSNKLTEIISNNEIKSICIIRMDVPCCKGIADASVAALKNSGKMIPWQIVTLSTEGQILDQ